MVQCCSRSDEGAEIYYNMMKVLKEQYQNNNVKMQKKCWKMKRSKKALVYENTELNEEEKKL